MRSQPNTNPQESGDQKKSVFDRLGRQLDTSRSLNRRSPAQYGENPAPSHPMMHEAEFGGRYGRGDPDMNAWRYQQERRHMPYGRDRHPPPVGPPLPPLPHFEMEMQPGRQPSQYYPHLHAPQYHANQPMQSGPPPPPLHMGSNTMGMGMAQRRPSPKYDRHGNIIRGPQRMDMPPTGMSPPGPYTGQPLGPMMHPGYDMPLTQPGMYPQNRWHENLEMGPPMMGRLLPDERFMDQQRLQQQSPRHQQQRQQQKSRMMNLDMTNAPATNFEAPRYSKWRERRDVITNLDRQTAQSSSKTDSFKSSLLQPDTRNNQRKANNQSKKNPKQAPEEESSDRQASTRKENTKSAEGKKGDGTKSEDKPLIKTDPPEISDGEIIDDEDSSDDSDDPTEMGTKQNTDFPVAENPALGRVRGPRENMHYYDAKKRIRLLDRDYYPMDYETISDDELDDFMSHKKLVECGDKMSAKGSGDGKSSSEIELLNALGLDWANLIELSKQSRNEAPTSGSALRRFSMSNYLPTLGITRELAGSEIYDLILRVCY